MSDEEPVMMLLEGEDETATIAVEPDQVDELMDQGFALVDPQPELPQVDLDNLPPIIHDEPDYAEQFAELLADGDPLQEPPVQLFTAEEE